ncbi:DarT ssDNA thymidine ADP-ribosyltransferase family protein [[Haemophilus] ducreyi]|uniref:DarT ssDNA thymidine ADP-ribosyltransferase family protein n=1 Tax=Haemophilus ducreyi TaxID=730 RepID=UPI000A569127|nr:DarT ssDNA thymidine ADP-ribosyltransferase family protein [[Haemophilus] ducreyi]
MRLRNFLSILQANKCKRNEYQEEIYSVIKKRDIKWLCHFTPRENLEKIKREGLRLRNINMRVTDSFRYDRNNTAICLSISQPNQWMFNKKKANGYDLCLLLINPEILFKKYCLFYSHNAATASFRTMSDLALSGAQALENLFSEQIIYQKSGREQQSIYRHGNLELCETTSNQAEVQCLDDIEPEYISYIFDKDIPLTYKELNQAIQKIKNSNAIVEYNEIIFEPPLEPFSSRVETIKEQQASWRDVAKEMEEYLHSEQQIGRVLQEQKEKSENNRKTIERYNKVSKNKVSQPSYNYSYIDGSECCYIIIFFIIIYIFIF